MRVVVVHYEVGEAAGLAARLRRDGIDAEAYPYVGAAGLRELRARPPDAVLIDLMRMPSYGRAIGSLLRAQKATRSIPLVFLEGDPEKTALTKRAMPDAAYTTVPKMAAALRKAVERPPSEPVVPDTSAAPLASKLRIKPGDRVGIVGAPEGFEIAGLPEGASARSGSRDGDVVLVFVKTAAGLGREIRAIAKSSRRMFWVAWPKRSSGAGANFSLTQIHEACAAEGLVGFMTCAVDRTWSAVAVARRKSGPPR